MAKDPIPPPPVPPGTTSKGQAAYDHWKATYAKHIPAAEQAQAEAIVAAIYGAIYHTHITP